MTDTDIEITEIGRLQFEIGRLRDEIERLRAALTEAIEFIAAHNVMNWSLSERYDHVTKLRAALNPKDSE